MKKNALITFNMLMWLPRIIFMTIVFFSIVFLTSWYARTEIQTWQTESELIAQRILYSPGGISYNDPLSNRLYPGVIDLTKFKDNSIPLLDDSLFYGTENKHIGANITIIDLKKNQLAQGIYNNIVYRRIAEKGRLGRGGVNTVEKQIYVLAKDETKTIPAIAQITIVIPRT